MSIMMNPTVATVSLFFSFVAIYVWNYTHWTRRKIKQGFQVPIFGDTFKHFFGISAFPDVLQAIYDKFPDTRYSGFYQYVQPGIMIKDPALIKSICMNRLENFPDRTPFMSETDDVLWNKTLFALRGEPWREMRNTLAHAFTGSRMKQMFPIIVDYSRKFSDTLEKREGETIEIEFKDLSQRFTNDVIANVAFGLAVDSLNDPDNDFFTHGRATTDSKDYIRTLKMKMTIMWPSLGWILNTNVFTKEISSFYRTIIKDTIEHRRQNNENRNDMLQLLMNVHEEPPEEDDDGPPRKLEIDDIASQALIFFLGGFETVTSSMCFMAYELAANPAIQKRLIKEIDEYKKKNPVPQYDHIVHNLQYLDMVLAEVFRKWPPILNLDRICTQDYEINPTSSDEEKITIEKDDLVWLPVWCIHHDPKYWPEPEKFDPERFNVENRPKNQDGKYIPFGLGGRSCIGARFAIIKIKLLFFELLQRFRIVAIPKSHIPFVPIKHTFNLASKYDFWFGLEKRKDKPTTVVENEDDKDKKLDEEKNNGINIFNIFNRKEEDENKEEDKGNSDEIIEDNKDNKAVDQNGKKKDDKKDEKIIDKAEEKVVRIKHKTELRKRGG